MASMRKFVKGLGVRWTILFVLVVGFFVAGGTYVLVKSIQHSNQLKPIEARMDEYRNIDGFTEAEALPYIAGKIITVNTNNGKMDGIFFNLPKEIRASNPDEVETVALLTWGEQPAGSYASGAGAYRGICDVEIVVRTTKTCFAHRLFYGPDPPESKSDTADWHGAKPTQDVIAYIAGLRRETDSNSSTGAFAVGDVGPAGGIVFYDKGDDSGGWRYLEAAPASTEQAAEWGVNETAIPGADGTAVGTGKQNTADIVAAQGAASTYAAELCEGLTYGGYDDWFLPSKDELNLMYTNLYSQGADGFLTTGHLGWGNNYWSSSESVEAAAASQDFLFEGEQSDSSYKNQGFRVRAVRAF